MGSYMNGAKSQNKMDQRTELENLGEFGLIQKIADSVVIKRSSTLLGIGDDAAVIQPESNKIVVSTDLLVEGIHFNLMYCPLKHLGYKAVSVNLSDIYAMNASPTQITVSIAISNRFSLEALEELYEGINLACKNYEVDLVGGDTSSSTSGLIISVTAIGEVNQDKIAYRSGAKEYDLVCVSGDLGGAYLGLQILEREKSVYIENANVQPDLTSYQYILERQLKPEPRRDIVDKLSELDITPTAMIDISDGLASEILHICKSSHVGCVIYEEKIPIDYEAETTAQELGLSPLICALNGGEDYELLFTISQADYDKLKDYKGVSVIGHITDKNTGAQLVSKGGAQIPLKAQGWDAFGS